MYRLSAAIGLLFCVIVTRADELPVIKDSDAVYYVGKNVEVRGFGRFRGDRPTGDRIYQFRTRSPQSEIRRVHCSGIKNGNWPRYSLKKLYRESKLSAYSSPPKSSQVQSCRFPTTATRVTISVKSSQAHCRSSSLSFAPSLTRPGQGRMSLL
jgi:hypothetical protein